MNLLYDRDNPDFENSIKEAITAVEAICQIITNNKATLSAALKQLSKNGVNIHPALQSAFEKLYAFTSDAGGIRHADGLRSTKATFEEAKYMLVTCSAFVNYLIALFEK